jgi:hypothetical protein
MSLYMDVSDLLKEIEKKSYPMKDVDQKRREKDFAMVQ